MTPHDYMTNVQKRLGNRVWVGRGQCRCCGSFLDPQLEHTETCSNSEATREHYACSDAVVCGMKLADPGITTEPRGLTASQSRPADLFTTAAVPRHSAALNVCVASSIAAAARGDAAQGASDRRQQGIQYPSRGWRTGDRTRLSLGRFSTQTSLPVGPAADVGEIPSSQVEARNPTRSPASEGSHGTRSSHEFFSASRVALRRHH